MSIDNDNDKVELESNNVRIEKIIIPFEAFPEHTQYEYKYRNIDVDEIVDNTHLQWKLEINDLDWLSIKERGNQEYISQKFQKARYAFLVASRKTNNDKDKAICLGINLLSA